MTFLWTLANPDPLIRLNLCSSNILKNRFIVYDKVYIFLTVFKFFQVPFRCFIIMSLFFNYNLWLLQYLYIYFSFLSKSLCSLFVYFLHSTSRQLPISKQPYNQIKFYLYKTCIYKWQEYVSHELMQWHWFCHGIA